MFFKRRALSIIALLLCVLIFSLIGKSAGKAHLADAPTNEPPKIILDAGHGGFDGGAVALDGTVEKDINLKICLMLRDFLSSAGYNVILTRQTDVSTDDTESKIISSRKKSDLKNRLNLMKDYPDGVFVSIHLNKFTTSAANGSQVFYGAKNDTSKILGEHIQKSIVNMLQPDNTRVNKKATSSTYLLYNATIPAVLVECGFLSNKQELALLKDTQYQKKMAFCIFCGINEYFSKGII